MSSPVTAEKIDAILPQTQCGLCGYGACMPYAEALVAGEAEINLCPPGGVKVLKEIADLINVDAGSYIPEMEKKAKPKLTAVIREDECIGCMKCIQACPVDAILGSAKRMHTVIESECTGCELCVAPCPVDCIDMIVIAEKPVAEEKQKADLARQRFRAREKRLLLEQMEQVLPKHKTNPAEKTLAEKQNYIQEAILRAKMKKDISRVK